MCGIGYISRFEEIRPCFSEWDGSNFFTLNRQDLVHKVLTEDGLKELEMTGFQNIRLKEVNWI